MTIRELSDEEVRTFHEQGWVYVPALIEPDCAKALAQRAKALMGEKALLTTGGGGGDPQFAEYRDILRNYLGFWKEDPLARELSHSTQHAKNASRLLRNRSVRFFNDEVLVKPPQAEGGKGTPWHQDFPHATFDRTGLINTWISLVELPPEGGAMAFLSGSHFHGPLGRTLLDEQDVVEQNPWLLDHTTIARPVAMMPGDATIHGDLTIHCGPAFDGPHWRWAYLINLMDASIRHTGATGYGEKTDTLIADTTFPEDRYPLLYTI